MTKYYKTVSASLEKETFNKFKRICEARNCSAHAILKDYIDDLIEMEGKKLEERRIEENNPRSNEGDEIPIELDD